jgi:hypothetical protein
MTKEHGPGLRVRPWIPRASHVLGLCLLSHESRSGYNKALTFHMRRPKGQSRAEVSVVFAIQTQSPSLIPMTQVRKPVPGACNSSTGKAETTRSLELTGQPGQISESHSSEGPASRKPKGISVNEEDQTYDIPPATPTSTLSHTRTLLHTYIYTLTHTLSHIHIFSHSCTLSHTYTLSHTHIFTHTHTLSNSHIRTHTFT